MGLSREDLRPLLELLRHEIANRQNGGCTFEHEFPLAEVNLEGNPAVEPEYQAAISHGLRQLAVFQLGADLSARPGGLAGADILPAAPRLDQPAWSYPTISPWRSFPSTEPHRLPLHIRDPGAWAGISSPGQAASTGAQGSRGGSSKSLPPTLRESRSQEDGEDYGEQGLERNAVSEGDADSDQEAELFNHRGRHDMKHQFQEELEAIAVRLSSPLQAGRPGSPPAGVLRRPATANAASQGSSSRDPKARGGRPASASVTSNETFSRGASIPVSAMPDRGGAFMVPDRGLECGFGPPVDARGVQASHLDPSDTDSEGSELDVQDERRAVEGWRVDDEWMMSGASMRGRAEVDRGLASASRERDPHERLYAVSEQLRDADIHPGGHVLRWTLDRISSDVSSCAEQVPGDASLVHEAPHAEAESDRIFHALPIAQ